MNSWVPESCTIGPFCIMGISGRITSREHWLQASSSTDHNGKAAGPTWGRRFVSQKGSQKGTRLTSSLEFENRFSFSSCGDRKKQVVCFSAASVHGTCSVEAGCSFWVEAGLRFQLDRTPQVRQLLNWHETQPIMTNQVPAFHSNSNSSCTYSSKSGWKWIRPREFASAQHNKTP